MTIKEIEVELPGPDKSSLIAEIRKQGLIPSEGDAKVARLIYDEKYNYFRAAIFHATDSK